MIHDIYIISNDKKEIEELRKSFKIEQDEYNFISIDASEIEVALRNIPAMIIIDEESVNANFVAFCKSVRENEDNAITPLVVLSSNKDRDHMLDILKTDVDYFVKKPIDNEYLFFVIRNLISLLSKNRRISPLTGLPGNVQIQAEMKKRLLNKEAYGILYFDLDNFKAYNDVYGFANGDEIIKFTARVITKHIHLIKNSDNFVGHIGGDDFVAIVSPTDYDKVCKDIISEFDKYAVTYYNEIDVERGFVEVANRRGIIEQFPLTTISIAVLEVDPRIYKTTLEIGEVASQIKHRAKTMVGTSSYFINRRRF